MLTEPLARFVDRDTLVYERHYDHPVELVFEAVSTAEHLNAWMLPGCMIERRVGGACAFGWGSPADHPDASRGTVSVFDPPRTIELTFEDASFMRFDVEPSGDGADLRFTLYFPPGQGAYETDDEADALPAGADTAWRPGFLTGFHEFLADLPAFLGGEFTAEDRLESFETPAQGHAELEGAYRDHIREHCPPRI